ncbi:MAG: OmpA family protein [Bacteroidetes bacterium]|nr:OmpA family protein [Bacteroidota bacterium]
MRHLILFFLFITGLSFTSYSQQTKHFYATIGVFIKESNAKNLAEKANQQGYAARYGQKVNGNLYYVYVLSTDDKPVAEALVAKLRAETEYKLAWIFNGLLEGDTTPNVPVIETKPIEPTPVPVVTPAETPVISTPKIDSAATTPIQKPIEKVEEKPVVKKPAGKAFYFKLISEKDGSEIKSGEVHIMESSTATQYQSFKPGEVVYLAAPKNKNGTYTIATQVPGYAQATVNLDYQNPAETKGASEEAIIEIAVPKAKKGDYIDFANVKFFKNSSILQPVSQGELDGVVDLLKENLNYKIKIHGHVNGTQDRESFTRGPNSSFFATSPSADVAHKKMSAKDLSEARAECVRDYLVSQGIDKERISVKGEGGRIPLYPTGGTLGLLNDRVEIEFVKH